jgi:D-tyrosyl-tRNA(Tyr) deacylase
VRIVVQRVSAATVTVADRPVGSIGPGLLVLAGVARGDTPAVMAKAAAKVARLRLFPDEAGRMNRAVTDTGGEILAVSQFTLLADCRKGTRPSFNDAAPPELARPLFDHFVAELTTALGRPVPTGKFGALMQVGLVNDGPVTLVLDIDVAAAARAAD